MCETEIHAPSHTAPALIEFLLRSNLLSLTPMWKWKCESESVNVKVKAMHRLMQLLNRLNFSAFKSTPKLTPNALRLQKEDIEGTVLLVTSASRDVFMMSICWNDKNCWVTHKIVQWCIKWRIDFYIPLLFTLIGLWKQEIRNESSGPESVVAIFVWSVGEQ